MTARSIRSSSRVFPTAVGLVSLACASPSLGQSQGSEASTPALEVVVVTANRRAEAIQSVPTAITAVSAESLREQNISTAQDLLGKVPSLTVTSNGTQRSAETVVIRGQGQTYLAPVGVVNYFAEVPLIQGAIISNQGGPGTFFDLESLQVLRGPQGTLFGKNTTGGALLLGPKRPTNQLEGHVLTQFGNYDDREFEGVLNLPVSDSLAIRASYKKVDRDGFTEDVGPGAFGYVLTPDGPSAGFAGRKYDDRHYWTARLGVLWQPNDTFENYLVAYRTESHDNGTGLSITDAKLTPSLLNLGANLFYRQPGDPLYGSNDPTIGQAILARQAQLGPRKTALNMDQFSRLEVTSIIDTMSLKLNDSLTVRNIAGYQRMKQSYAWDLDGSILPLTSQNPTVVTLGSATQFGREGEPTNITDLSQFSIEPQLLGDVLEGDLTTIVGAFYSKVKPEGVQAQGSFNFGTPGAAYYATETKSTAVYGQATLNLGALTDSLDELRFTLGARHSWEEYDGRRFSRSYFNIPFGQAKEEDTATTWNVGVDYAFTPTVMAFAKVTRGYKAGGFNVVAVQPSGLTYGPEEVTSHEIGLKTDFQLGEMPMRLNVAAFNLDYDGIQRAASDNAFNNFQNAAGLDQGSRTFNAGTAEVNGIELEAVALPLDNLEVSASYSYSEGKYKRFFIDLAPDPIVTQKDTCHGVMAIPSPYVPGAAPVTANLSCLPFPFLPEHQFNVNVRHRLEMGAAGRLVSAINYAWVDDQYGASTSTLADNPGAVMESYGLLNLSLEWQEILGQPLDVRFFMSNATDETYRISNANLTDTAFGTSASIYGEPRMYGMSLAYRFGQK